MTSSRVSAVAENSQIGLSQWYACLPLGRDLRPPAARGPIAGSVRVGALRVYRPDEGCVCATFGREGSESGVVAHGYLFDRDELLDELGLGPASSLADLVAAGYRRWGEDAFERFEGRFLVAVWDGDERRLLVARDDLGRDPVFYAVTSDALWFSANVLALAGAGDLPRVPNRLSLALSLLRYWPAAGQTFFDGIQRLRPNHRLRVSLPGTVREYRYAEEISDYPEPWLPDAEARERFEPELEHAVARCMKLGAQGVMLSGGVDSVTVAALAVEYTTRHESSALAAVSGQSGAAVLNYEERTQGAAARALSMPHLVSTTVERLRGEDGVRLSLECAHELASPAVVSWFAAYRRFYEFAAARRLTTLLTGSGGDDWLRVPDAYAADLLGRLDLRELVRFLRSDAAAGSSSPAESMRRLLWRHGIRLHIDTILARLAPRLKSAYHLRRWTRNLPRWISPDPVLREHLLHELLGRRPRSLTRSGRRPASYYWHALASVDNPYMYQEFENGFHVEALCGVRLLSPFHDPRLVRFFRRISPRTLLHGGRYKGLLRPVVQRRLPGLGLEHQRKEYPRLEQAQSARALQASIEAAWRRLAFENLSRLGVVEGKALHGDLEADAGGLQTHYRLAQRFCIMSTERWAAAHTPG